MMSMSQFENTLRERKTRSRSGRNTSLTDEEVDAIASALDTLREIAGMGEGWLTTSALAKAALAKLDGVARE
jgi:hypothetical protein